MDLKDLLKTIKMNESRLSTLLGFLVIAVIGVMVFNYFRNIQPGTTTPTAVVTENTQQDKSYTVKAGDSLSSIAREFYGNPNKWTVIADANDIDNTNNLEIGQELTIPADSTIAQASPVASSAATIKPTPSPIPSVAPTAVATIAPTEQPDDKQIASVTTYTVERGDSLWSIAEKVYGDGYQWTKIASENNLKNPNIIHAGNVFSIPR